MFTQAEISWNKIAYRPETGEIGVIPRMITFTLDVQDEGGNIQTGEKSKNTRKIDVFD